MLLIKPDKNFMVDQVLAEVATKAALGKSCLVIDFSESKDTRKNFSLVQKLKSTTDLILLAQVPSLSDRQQVEEIFKYGVHGIVFTGDALDLQMLERENVVSAKKLFCPGAVFLEIKKLASFKEAREVVKAGVVPLCAGLKESEIEALLATCGLESRWLRYAGYYPAGRKMGLTDRLIRKYLLELANFKHTLRVKQVEESYRSSSL
ncbi:MAG: hypothetical protein AB1497_01695 [Bacillota bacterium]